MVHDNGNNEIKDDPGIHLEAILLLVPIAKTGLCIVTINLSMLN